MTEKVKEAIARMEAAGEPSPTVFEAETAIAFLYFKKKKCDLVVLESGLGGRLDATNIIRNTVCAVFATISVDHLGVIGNTLEEIAAELNAGIIKPGCTVVSASNRRECAEDPGKTGRRIEAVPISQKQQPEQMIIQEDYHGITFSYKELRSMHSRLAGECQRENLATALEIIGCFGTWDIRIPEEAVSKGLEQTRLAGKI